MSSYTEDGELAPCRLLLEAQRTLPSKKNGRHEPAVVQFTFPKDTS